MLRKRFINSILSIPLIVFGIKNKSKTEDNYASVCNFCGHPVKQMNGKFGGMVAFELEGGLQAAESLMNNVEIITLAPSLGCSKSLIQHPASMSHVKVPRKMRIESGITDGLVRFSVGLEDVDDLIEDLAKALS